MTGGRQEKGVVLLVCDKAGPCDEIAEILGSDEFISLHQAPLEEDLAKVASATVPDIVICDEKTLEAFEVRSYRQSTEDDDFLLSPLFLLLADGMSPREIADSLEHNVDDFIQREVCGDILLPKVRSLLCKRRLRQNLWKKERRLAEANDLLERNFRELKNILLKILEIRVPGAGDRSRAAEVAADFISDRLGIHETRKKQIAFAALLHEIGKIGLPDDVVSKHYCSLPAPLVSIFQQQATVGSIVVSAITGYREAAEAVHHQLQNYDGSGFPGDLMGDEIPIGSRILRAIALQEELEAQGLQTESIVERVRSAMHSVLDQSVANLLIEFLHLRGPKAGPGEIKVPVDELTIGMTIAEDIFAASGVKLLPKGIKLQEKTLALLLERNAADPIIGGVYVATDTFSQE